MSQRKRRMQDDCVRQHRDRLLRGVQMGMFSLLEEERNENHEEKSKDL